MTINLKEKPADLQSNTKAYAWASGNQYIPTFLMKIFLYETEFLQEL